MATIRRTEERDLDPIGDIAEAKRREYARYSPVFWRPHPEGRAPQIRFLRRQLTQETTLAFVSEERGAIGAFGIAVLRSVPAVDQPSGPVCLVDDFATLSADAWPTSGWSVLDAILSAAAGAGAALAVVISGRDDGPKCAMLEGAGFGPDSGWHVRERDRATAAAPSADVRPAEARDAAGVLDLAIARRAPYERYQPSLWRRAGASRGEQVAAVASLIGDPNVATLVHETAGRLDGYAFGTVTSAPPVYDPGGPVCVVDDFAADGTDATAGLALLEAISRHGHERGTVLTVVIAGHADAPKRRLVAEHGFRQASEFYTRPLNGDADEPAHREHEPHDGRPRPGRPRRGLFGGPIALGAPPSTRLDDGAWSRIRLCV